MIKLPGKHGDIFASPTDCTSIVDLPGGRCSLVVGGKNVIVMAKACEVLDALQGKRHGAPWPARPGPVVIDAPEEEGKELGQVGGVT